MTNRRIGGGKRQSHRACRGARPHCLAGLLLVSAALAGASGSGDVVAYELMGTGYVIDHPGGWTATRDVIYDRGRMVSVVTVLSELAADQDLDAEAKGLRLTIDHMQMPVMSPALRDGPVLTNLHAWYREFYDWAEPVATERTELFGAPALLMTAQRQDGSWEFAAMGWAEFPELGLGGYAIHLAAPPQVREARGQRIWEALVTSIRPLVAGTAN